MNNINFDDLDLDGLDLGVETGKAVNSNNGETNLQEVNLDIEISTDLTPQAAVLEDEGVPDLSEFLGEVEKVNTTKKPSNAKTGKTVEAKPKKAPYKGPRIIKVYGDELWVENDPNVTNEEIRTRIVEEFGYGEFRKEKTIFDLDEETGILDIAKSFHKKG